MARKYLVVGKQPVLGRRKGQHVYLEDAHGDRLTRGGHVEPVETDPPDQDPEQDSEPATEPPAPEPDPSPLPKRKAKNTTKPRQTPGLSHVPDPAPAADDNKE